MKMIGSLCSKCEISEGWCKDSEPPGSIPVCGSVFGCHCENSFPDTYNNIQCSRCLLFFHGACYNIPNNSTKMLFDKNMESQFVCGFCSIKNDILCSNPKIKSLYKDKEKMTREELDVNKYQGLVSRALQSIEDKEHLQFPGSSKPDLILFLRFKFGLCLKEAVTVFDLLEAKKAGNVEEDIEQKNVIPLLGKADLMAVARTPVFTNILKDLDVESKMRLREVSSTLKSRIDELDPVYPIVKIETLDPAAHFEEFMDTESLEAENINDADIFEEKSSAVQCTATKKRSLNNKNKVFACGMCDKVYLSNSSFLRHKKRDHLNIRYPCPLCEYVATSTYSLKTHKENIHEGKRYPCGQCDYVATQMVHLREHKANKHEGISYPCDACNYAATTPAGLKNHIETKHSELEHLCDQCGYKSSSNQYMKMHKARKHGESGKSYRSGTIKGHLCDECPFTAYSAQALKIHKDNHESIEYPCDQCDYTGKRHALYLHKYNKHNARNFQIFSCGECDFVTNMKDKLNKHVNVKHKQIKYCCDQCDYVATYKVRLDQHISYVHQGVAFSCDQCEYKGRSKEIVRKHKEAKHEGLRYYCDQCIFSSTTKGDLTRHKDRKHTVKS